MTRRGWRKSRLEALGFFPIEARELSRVTAHGMRAPYFRHMMADRKELHDRAKSEGWTSTQYRDAVRKIYTDRGFIKTDKLGRQQVDVWARLREYEEAAHRRGEEYDSPWKKRLRTKGEGKKEVKRVTRRDMAISWIKQLDAKIATTKGEYRRNELIKQRDNLQKQLDAMG